MAADSQTTLGQSPSKGDAIDDPEQKLKNNLDIEFTQISEAQMYEEYSPGLKRPQIPAAVNPRHGTLRMNPAQSDALKNMVM